MTTTRSSWPASEPNKPDHMLSAKDVFNLLLRSEQDSGLTAWDAARLEEHFVASEAMLELHAILDNYTKGK